MKDVRVPKGASITMGRDDYRRATGGSGVGWGIAAIIVVAAMIGSTDGPDSTPTDSKPSTTPRPAASATR